MRTTFLNQNAEKDIHERGLEYLSSRENDFRVFMEDTEGNEETGSFYDYGLCFDYVELGSFDDQKQDYFRYQFSWGGPSDELRFYDDGEIEYVFLDWFSGVGFDVTCEDWAMWCKDWFRSCDMMNFEEEREKYDYYDILYGDEEEEEE